MIMKMMVMVSVDDYEDDDDYEDEGDGDDDVDGEY